MFFILAVGYIAQASTVSKNSQIPGRRLSQNNTIKKESESLKLESASAAKGAKSTLGLKSDLAVKVPPLKNDEYAIFVNNTYEVFKTQNFEQLEIDRRCFKNGKPKCEAYLFSQMKPASINSPDHYIANLGAAHCHAVYGMNLIALDSKRNQYNFCRFKDGSMVNSWSLYFKRNPAEATKR